MSEIIFVVLEDGVDGGYTASALGHAIFTEADSLEELRRMVAEVPGYENVVFFSR